MRDSGDGPLPERVRVLVVGAGFSGIGAAVTLAGEGHDVLVLERGPTVGGTWRDNAYPGCACDVQSALYSFSFAPNPRWSRVYAPQPEILTYLQDVVARFGVGDRIRCGVEVLSAAWDAATARWRVGTSAGEVSCDVLVSAAGPLSQPRTPDLPGARAFVAGGGEILHTGHWDPATDLAGRRVAVVGTGASAVQVVPRLAEVAASVTVLQRTPPWIMPRNDREIPAPVRRRYARRPGLQRAARWAVYAQREVTVVPFVHRPGLMRGVEAICRRHLRAQVPDPGLRLLLTPDYRAGCKRILLSDDYYPALLRDGVELVPSAAAALEPGAVITADGHRREIDTLVLATGFEPTEPPIARHVRGRDGRLLADVWAGTGMQALRGTTVHGFPNLFLLIGPNTGLGHTSMLQVVESQLAYVADALRLMDRHGLAALEPSAAAQEAWNRWVSGRMRGTVWATGGCVSWYQDPSGRVTTIWPGSTVRLRHQTRRLDPAEYRATPRGTL